MNDSRPVVQQIVEDTLGIKQAFLLERRDSIITRLSSAAKAINSSVTDNILTYPTPKKDAIDKCLYLAISILFTGSSTGGFDAAKNYLSATLVDSIHESYDPVDVAAACVLWYLLRVFPVIVENEIGGKSSEIREFPNIANDIGAIFDKARWFLTDEILKKLEFLPKPTA